ncbi:fibronectin-binding protein RevA [Borreliella bavariensis]|uniref:fibronectin-binding protein RevA n=1 Tax=Borreliella bavariensis TaxID=664662 RepID=UPI00165E498D|nr:fibronectin-binding protein RevA [Borreliella bavariensis]WLN24787.1 fibronectin-binding protein RevA [Borreliella bavariensis]
MKNKNIVKLFFISMLFIIVCKVDVEKKYVEENKKIDLLFSSVSTLKNDSKHDNFKKYQDKINQLKESLKDVGDSELKEKLLKLQSLFKDKLAAKLTALKLAKQTIEGISDKDKEKETIWKESKLVGVTVPLSGSSAAGKGQEMANNATSKIDKIIEFLEEGTN